jgi:hypothetical protein
MAIHERRDLSRLTDLRNEVGILRRVQAGLETVGPAKIGDRYDTYLRVVNQTHEQVLLEAMGAVVQVGDRALAGSVAQDILESLHQADEDTVFRIATGWKDQLLSLLLLVGDDPVADSLSDALTVGDPSDATEREMWHLKLVRKAEQLFEEGEYAESIRKVWPVIDDPSAPKSILLQVREVRARGFRGLRDDQRELNELLEWDVLLSDSEFRGGAVEYATAVLHAGAIPGARGKQRAEWLIRFVSRLIVLLERADDHDSAREFYQALLEHGYHDWVDPTMKDLGTIRDRARRGSIEMLPKLIQPHESAELEVLCPAERYANRVDRDEAERIITEAWGRDVPWNWAIQLARVPFSENRFSYSGRPENLVTELASLVENSPTELPGLKARRVEAVFSDNGTTPKTVLVISHDAAVDELRGVSLLVRAVAVGDNADLTMRAAFFPGAENGDTSRNRVVRLISSDLDQEPGYRALRDHIVDVLVKAGRRLNNTSVASIQS